MIAEVRKDGWCFKEEKVIQIGDKIYFESEMIQYKNAKHFANKNCNKYHSKKSSRNFRHEPPNLLNSDPAFKAARVA